MNRGADYGLELPVTYKLVGVSVDWAQKNIEKALEVVNKKVEKCTK